MWNEHLSKVVGVKTQISELDTILGKKEEDIDNEKLGNLFNIICLGTITSRHQVKI